MGAFFTNLQVRATDAAAVAAALEPLLKSGLAWVSPVENGWVSVYPESTEKQNPRVMEALASGLSASLGTSVLGTLVHDSDILHLWVYAGGTLLDEFDSNPDYFKRASQAEKERLKGRPEVFAEMGPSGTSPAAVADALAGGRGKAPLDAAMLAKMNEELESQVAKLTKDRPGITGQVRQQMEAMLGKLAAGAPVFAEGRFEALAACGETHRMIT